jgi:hypothetical protein
MGRGAVKDTYHRFGEGVAKRAGRLGQVEGEEGLGRAEKQGWSRYGGSSLKGAAAIDGDEQAQGNQLLSEVVQDGRRLRPVAEKVKEEHPEPAEAMATDAGLRRRLMAHEVEEKPGGGCEVKQGRAKDGVVSVHDAELRQGRKSASQRFEGHQAAVAVEIDRQWSSAVEVLPGKAGPKPALERGVIRTKSSSSSALAMRPFWGTLRLVWIHPTELGSNCSLRIPTIRLAA